MARNLRLLFASAGAITALLAAACSSGEKSGTAVPVAGGGPPVAWKEFSGERALADVKSLCDIGPHPSGSQGIERARKFLEQQLKAAGWVTQRETFRDRTPHGEVEFANIRARLPVADAAWSRTGVDVILCSHYDSKFFADIVFVGANDGGSSTGLLLEFARVLPLNPAVAARVELVFFDGEEAIVDYRTDPATGDFSDGLYGSRYHARTIRTRPRDQQPTYALLFDMVGDKDLRIEFPSNTSPNVNEMAFSAAAEAGVRQHFGLSGTAMVDDHVPLGRIGLQVTDFIDFSYQAHWHKASDTMDKLSAESLSTVGRTALLMLEKYLPK